MKKITLTISLALFIFLFTSIKIQNSSELVYVNKLLEGYKRTKIVRTEFLDFPQNMEQKINELINRNILLKKREKIFIKKSRNHSRFGLPNKYHINHFLVTNKSSFYFHLEKGNEWSTV